MRHPVPKEHLLACAKDACNAFDKNRESLVSPVRIDLRQIAPDLGPEERNAALARLASKYYLAYSPGDRYAYVAGHHRGYLDTLLRDNRKLSELAAAVEVESPPVSNTPDFWNKIKGLFQRKKS